MAVASLFVAWSATGGDPPPAKVALPANRTLRPDLEALPLEPEAALTSLIVARAGVLPVLEELQRGLDGSEEVSDAYRLGSVRYLHRDPARLPGATKLLGRAVAKAADLRELCQVAGPWLDAGALPVSEVPAPARPGAGASVQAHVDYCLGRMRRARSLVELALARVDPEARRALVPDWERLQSAVGHLAAVDRAALLAALAELAALSEVGYLDQLAADLEAAEKGALPGSGVLFEGSSDLGDVIVGGSGPNAYERPYALCLDLGGDDRYPGSIAAAQGPARPVALAIDLAGDDAWEASGPVSQGAALMGVALLIERKGNDRYATKHPLAQGAAACGAAALIDLAGNDTFRGEACAQGAALVEGLGLLVDAGGDDVYEAGLHAQGFAGPGGFGACVGRGGDDRYRAQGLRPDSYGDSGPGIWEGRSQGFACGLRGLASGGVALLVDDGGDDTYLAGNFSQGGGYYFAWGALCDLGGGKDRYDGSRWAQACAAHQAVGSLWDDGGDDHYSTRVIAAQGVAWDLSVVAFMDEAGDDTYESGGTCKGAAAHNGFALFYDGDGVDTYQGKAPARAGPNDYHGGPSLAVFIDAGGATNVYARSAGVGRGLVVSEGTAIRADLPFGAKGASAREIDACLHPRPGK